MVTHRQIWDGIDRLAESRGLSTAALARMAGLDATSLGTSKRVLKGRACWPSTEMLAAVLNAAGSDLVEFASLASPSPEDQECVVTPALSRLAVMDLADLSDWNTGCPEYLTVAGPCPAGAFLVRTAGGTGTFPDGTVLLAGDGEAWESLAPDSLVLAALARGPVGLVQFACHGEHEVAFRSLDQADPLGSAAYLFSGYPGDGNYSVEPLPGPMIETLPRQDIAWIARIIGPADIVN